MKTFGERLYTAMRSKGPLCVGIDPHPALLAGWDLPDSASGVRDFSRIVLEALTGKVAAIKPQAAFFERHGSEGMTVLEEIVAHSAEHGIISIVDAKRGDIGSTMAGYADAFLREGGPFAGDALTISPYLGVSSLAETVETARANARGVFILALTSNPEGQQVQHARSRTGESVASQVASFAAGLNAGCEPIGDVGLVVGATVGDAPVRTRTNLQVNGPLLVPGVGAQGGRVSDLVSTFGAATHQVLVSSSREILQQGPDQDAIVAAAKDLSTRLGALQNMPSFDGKR